MLDDPLALMAPSLHEDVACWEENLGASAGGVSVRDRQHDLGAVAHDFHGAASDAERAI